MVAKLNRARLHLQLLLFLQLWSATGYQLFTFDPMLASIPKEGQQHWWVLSLFEISVNQKFVCLKLYTKGSYEMTFYCMKDEA